MAEREATDDSLVTVLTVRDPGLLAVAQSLLDGADIPYFVKSENSWNATPLMMWAEVQVGPEDVEEARALLADLSKP